jgi:hypothetical protein
MTKDVEQYKAENENLRKELANTRMQLRQSIAAHKALDALHGNTFRDCHSFRTQCNLLSDELQEKLSEIADLKKQNEEQRKNLNPSTPVEEPTKEAA